MVMTSMRGNKGNAGLHEAIAYAVSAVVAFAAMTGFLALAPGIAGGYTNSVNAIGAVNVLGTCFIFLIPNTINFGSIEPGSNVPTANVVTDNDLNGNVDANILVGGSTWTSSNPTGNSFGSTNTLWNPTSLATYGGNGLVLFPSLTITDIVVPFGPGTSANVYYGLGIPPSQPLGIYTQNIVMENSC